MKFRVWDNALNYPMDGSFLRLDKDGQIYEVDDDEDAQCNLVEDQSRYCIERFTGIKDTEGQDIYEGDILEEEYEREGREPCSPTTTTMRRGAVCWDSHQGRWAFRGKENDFYKSRFDSALYGFALNYRVIGNIHEM